MSLPKCGVKFANGMPDPAHVHSCIVEAPCTAAHWCDCGQSWRGGLGEQARLEPQEAAGAPEVPPGVQSHLEAAGEALAAALAPMVAMIAERDEVLGRLVPQLLALQTSLGNVLAWMERAGIRPNWATDVRTLEEARALLASLSPKEDDAEADRPS